MEDDDQNVDGRIYRPPGEGGPEEAIAGCLIMPTPNSVKIVNSREAWPKTERLTGVVFRGNTLVALLALISRCP